MRGIIEDIRGKKLSTEERCQKAVALAGLILEEANQARTAEEKSQQEQLSRMMADPKGKAFATALTDQCFRSSSSIRVASQLIFLLNKYGIPQFLTSSQQTAFKLFKSLGKILAAPLVPLVQRMVRKETANVIIQGDEEHLLQHLQKRYDEKIRINLNHLGEAMHGEEEAQRRLQMYLEDLARPEVEYISVKISSIFSQINLIAWEETLNTLAERLRELYRVANKHTFTRHDGTVVPKFVNLDMEEYRELLLTKTAFYRVLDEPEFLETSAGIVLQAYVPDSYEILKEVTAWAKKRGGAQIKVRIVKGANLAMERVDSAIHCWPQAPYTTKADTDANFIRMLNFALQSKNTKAVRIGVGSHNLFDVAYAYLLAIENGVEDQVIFEMLEGMANPMSRVVHELTGKLLLYCPAAEQKDFETAIAYLTRRLDENTAPENFLRHLFGLDLGSQEWNEQVERFKTSCIECDKPSSKPRRTQDRTREPSRPEPSTKFQNEADTDWSLPQNRKWAEEILSKWSKKTLETIPLATEEQLEKALQVKVKPLSVYERTELLEEAAHVFRRARGDLIGAMIANGNKTIAEADVEISEAIDFIDYYRRMIIEFSAMEDVRFTPKGIALVTPPWNFPCSIPTGGIAAALAAGNVVLFKPAPETTYIGWMIANLFWQAGFSKEQLQFLPCEEETVGTKMLQDPRVNLVILTGATETAKYFHSLRPGMDLLAETGGKNSIIVTAMADRDLAIASIIQSAFGHAGQKCSACSLAILEAEIYDCPKFRRQLRDAAASLRVGSAWDPATKVNPLIRYPDEKLLRGLTKLEPGEEWLLEPFQHSPTLWSPGIKYGVREGSFTQTTELFGPVLGVMRAKNFDHAIELANATRYGLTAGLQSLDPREQKIWTDRIEAGNCYINRGITGAVVQRQPFGGCKESSFGPGAKAGGPNYILQLMHAQEVTLPRERENPPEEITKLNIDVGNYAFHWKNYFSKDHDPSKVLGQDNIFRYVPRKNMIFRVQEEDSQLDILRVYAAAKICGTDLQVSSERKLPIPHIREDEATLIARLKNNRIRIIGKPSEQLAKAAYNLITGPVLANGRLELLHYLREVSISSDYHRYGNLGDREQDVRAPLPNSTSRTQEYSLWT